MNTLTPFIRHEMTNLPNATHGRAQNPQDSPAYSMESHCIPCRQKNARSFLAGETPGVMQFYAPETGDRQAQQKLQPLSHTESLPIRDLATEDDETVLRLVEWREESPNS